MRSIVSTKPDKPKEYNRLHVDLGRAKALELQLRIHCAVVSGSSAFALHSVTISMPKIINVPRNKYPPKLEDPRMVSYLARAVHLHGQQTVDSGGDALRQSKRSGSGFGQHALFAEGFKALLKAARVQRVEARNLLEVIA